VHEDDLPRKVVVVLVTAVCITSLEPVACYKLVHRRVLGLVCVSLYSFVGEV